MSIPIIRFIEKEFLYFFVCSSGQEGSFFLSLFVCVSVSFSVCVSITGIAPTGWRRIMGCLIFIGHFPQKSPIVSGSFAKNDQQLQACYEFSPPCIYCV